MHGVASRPGEIIGHMGKWKRVGAQPLFVSFTAAAAALCGLIVVWVLLFARPFNAGLAGVVAGVLVLGLFAWRLNRMGVYIGETAVRHRSFAWTRTVPWSEVDGVHTQPLTTPAGQRVEIWIDLKNGKSLQTGVLFKDSLNSFIATEPSAPSEHVTAVVTAARGRAALDRLRLAHLAAKDRPSP